MLVALLLLSALDPSDAYIDCVVVKADAAIVAGKKPTDADQTARTECSDLFEPAVRDLKNMQVSKGYGDADALDYARSTIDVLIRLALADRASARLKK